jgi:GT2 family glycosyltransferase
MPRLAVVVPLWNQWDYTRQFLESYEAAASGGFSQLILVDNGSSDGTGERLKEYQKRLKFLLIRNAKNRGCAPAWNQGVRAALKLKATWIGIFNNDLLLGASALSRLLERAEAKAWDLVSPATREGELNYDFDAYADAYVRRCFRWDAPGWYGWCFVVRASVFRSLGLFDEGFRLGIGEDEDFMRRMQGAGLRLGVTGSAFVHHFGSRSLNALRQDSGRAFEEENLKRLRERWGSPAWRSPLRKLRDLSSRFYARLRWGHLLKE